MFQAFGPSLCPFSPEYVEGVFCELRLYRILGSSSPWRCAAHTALYLVTAWVS